MPFTPLASAQLTKLGWAATLGATALAAAIRLTDLDNSPHLVFDETYYVKDAWSLIAQGYEGDWADESNPGFNKGDTSGLSSKGSYVVHPPLGKFLIGLGMVYFGQASRFGWRVSAALAGIIGVFLICRLAWLLFASPVLTLMAGLFLATDGIHVSMSRVGLLDVFLSTMVLAGFFAIAKDRQSEVNRLELATKKWLPASLSPLVKTPGTALRPWLITAGFLLGAACAIKWSGIYAIAVLGLFVVIHEFFLRRRLRLTYVLFDTYISSVAAFFQLVGTAFITYALSWASWFAHPNAWGHKTNNAVVDLINYHKQVWTFHTGLSTPHSYSASPLGWLIQLRPTSMDYESGIACGDGESCARAVLALGNPLLWWIGALALTVLLVLAIAEPSWQRWILVLGYVATYVPWFLYLERTVFNFYTVVIAPFVALTTAWALWMLAKVRWGWIPSVIIGAAILFCAAWFSPIWTGTPILEDEWRRRMWISSWI